MQRAGVICSHGYDLSETNCPVTVIGMSYKGSEWTVLVSVCLSIPDPCRTFNSSIMEAFCLFPFEPMRISGQDLALAHCL